MKYTVINGRDRRLQQCVIIAVTSESNYRTDISIFTIDPSLVNGSAYQVYGPNYSLSNCLRNFLLACQVHYRDMLVLFFEHRGVMSWYLLE